MPTPLPYQLLAKPPGSGWQYVGNLLNATHEHATPGGAQSLEGFLPGNPRFKPAYLTTGTRIAGMIHGVPVWSGQVEEADADGNGWQLLGRGPCKYLYEDLALNKFLVKYGADDWRNARDYDVAKATWSDGYNIDTGNGIINIAVPHGTTVAANTWGTVVLDAGPAGTIKRVTVTYAGGGHASFGLYAGSGATVGALTETQAIDVAPIATGSTTASASFTTARRYAHVGITNTSGGAAAVAAATAWVKITDIIVYSDTAYESGNASILKASDIATIVAGNIDTDVGSTSTTGITATTTNLPEFTTDGYESAGDMIDRANSVDGREWYFTTDLTPRLTYRATPTGPATYTIPLADARNATGAQSLVDTYNQVRVRWVNGKGEEQSTTVTLSPDTTPLGLLGLTRTAELELRRNTDSTNATAAGNAFLAQFKRPPIKRSIPVRDSITLTAGGSVPAGLVKAYDRVLLPNEQNPQGGRGVIASVTRAAYDHESRTVELELDASFSTFDQQLARFEAGVRWRRG